MPRLTIHRPDAPLADERGTAPAGNAVPPLMVRSKQAARLFSMSLASWHRLDASGKTPAATRLGGAKLYRLDELTAWARRGCPPRSEWAVIWADLTKKT